MHLNRQPSPGRSASPLNGSNSLAIPQSVEQLIAETSGLKTRVSELEVINELFRGRVTQLEQDEANARRGEEMRRESEQVLIHRLEESQRRENQLKRRLDDTEREKSLLERELAELKENGPPPAKKMRVCISKCLSADLLLTFGLQVADMTSTSSTSEGSNSREETRVSSPTNL